MTPRTLPRMPRYDRWPQTIISTELLRGTLVPCGPGVRGVGWPDNPRIRAAAIAAWFSPDLIAIDMTAAWIWGACHAPGSPLKFSTRHRRRPSVLTADTERDIRQLAVNDEACHELDEGVLVTQPLRTACDLLRAGEPLTRTRRLTARLLIVAHGGRDAAAHALHEGPRPERRRALNRLAEL